MTIVTHFGRTTYVCFKDEQRCRKAEAKLARRGFVAWHIQHDGLYVLGFEPWGPQSSL